MKYAISALLLLFVCSLHGQTGFKYQSVVRDATGEIAANQSVSFRMGVVQDAINNAPVYQEI